MSNNEASNALIKEAVSAGIAAAVEVMVRGITVNDLQESENTLNTAYPNKSTKGSEYQVVIENRSPVVKVPAKARKSMVSLRKYQAIYALKSGQSAFYAKPENRSILTHQQIIRKSSSYARKHTPSAQFVTQRSIENGVLGVRVYRVK